MRVNVVKHRLLSFILCVTVMASTIAGAMIISFDFASAKSSSDSGDVAFDDLWDQFVIDAGSFLTSSVNTTYYNLIYSYLDNPSYLINVMHDEGTTKWSFAVFSFNLGIQSFGDGSSSGLGYSNVSQGVINRVCSIYFNGSAINFTQAGNQKRQFSRTNQYNYSDLTAYSNYWDIQNSSRFCWFSQDVTDGFSNATYHWSADQNLFESVTPPILDFNFFKFNLGDRWYLTTNDQSWVNGMSQEDEYYNVWELNFFRSDGTFDDRYIESPAMVRLSYAQNFMSQTLTNVSSAGVFAYDITELINDETYLNVSSNFFRAFETPGGYLDLTFTGQSMDIVDLVLTPQEEDPARNEAWTIINNYFENYPTVTVAPLDLAQQLSGNKAVSSGFGKIQIPEQIAMWMDDGVTLRGIDTDFHYDFTVSGLDPDDSTQHTMINYDILDVCIIPSKPSVQMNLDVADFTMPMYYWQYTYSNDFNDGYIFSPVLAYNSDYDDVWENYDIVFIMDPDTPWLLDPNYEFDLSHLTSFSRVGYQGPDIVRGNFSNFGDGVYQGYWVLTKRALQKNQLYVFCDGFYKMYDMMEQYIQKRNLWDTSFFMWTSGLFLQIDSLDGKLGKIYDLMNNWKLSTQFELLFDKLDQIGNNMVEPDLSDVDPWYLPLWNWVNRFAPSVNDFSGSIEAIDDTFEELPAIPQVTDPPAIPTLPGFE